MGKIWNVTYQLALIKNKTFVGTILVMGGFRKGGGEGATASPFSDF